MNFQVKYACYQDARFGRGARGGPAGEVTRKFTGGD